MFDYFDFPKDNNKGADQSVQMRRLVCGFVVSMQQSQLSHVKVQFILFIAIIGILFA